MEIILNRAVVYAELPHRNGPMLKCSGGGSRRFCNYLTRILFILRKPVGGGLVVFAWSKKIIVLYYFIKNNQVQ